MAKKNSIVKGTGGRKEVAEGGRKEVAKRVPLITPKLEKGVVKDKGEMIGEKNLDRMTYTLVENVGVKSHAWGPNIPVIQGKKKKKTKKVVEQYSKYESGDEEIDTTVQEGEETIDDDDTFYEDDSDYDSDDDVVDEGMAQQVARYLYDSQDDVEVDSKEKNLVADASLTHISEGYKDSGKDFRVDSAVTDKGNNKVEDQGRTIHFSSLHSLNQQEEQPIEDSLKQQPKDYIVELIDDRPQLTDLPTEAAKDKSTTSSMRRFDDLPTIGSTPAYEILMSLLDRSKTLEEDVEEIKLVVQTSFAMQKKETKTMLYIVINLLKQDIRMRMRLSQLTALPSPDDDPSAVVATIAETSKEDQK
ncbi:hypothetical protein Scep_004440 [Stephania cephalantha]|uniref:Uncharacterized protein n=1 Tax=Stephania cephalantha TaxID=152367 RepID=A0AAP0KSG9_9MAGN